MEHETGFVITGFEFYTFKFRNNNSTQVFATFTQFNHSLKFFIEKEMLLEEIFEYIPSKRKFKKMSKKRLKLVFASNEETIELLKKLYLIK